MNPLLSEFPHTELGPREICDLPLSNAIAPPERLFVAGRVPSGSERFFCIVGSRGASRKSWKAAFGIARDLTELGFVIVSGLARGVDSAAHEGALAARGRTIAFLAHGLQRIYPPENVDLARRILGSGGALITEYGIGTEVRRHHFAARNRLIAGLCEGCLVVEAPAKSGSRITAGFALENGKEVFALPGLFGDPAFEANHLFIQYGAKLVHRVEDILSELREPPNGRPSASRLVADSGVEIWRNVFQQLSGEGSLADLVEVTGDTIPAVSAALDRLRAMGHIVSLGPQRWAWAGDT